MHIYWLHISLEASVIGLTHAAYILSVVRTFYVDVCGNSICASADKWTSDLGTYGPNQKILLVIF